MGEELQAALNKLDLVALGESAGLVFEKLPSCGFGPCRDPFRRDDKHPSFQVVADSSGRAVGYKDYTSDKTGNIWQFATRCWPGMSSGDLAAKLIDMAGTRSPEKGKTVGAKTYQQRCAEARKARAAQRKRVEERLSAQVSMPAAAVPPAAAYSEVYDRYRDGVDFASNRWALMEALCARRGWPEYWGDWLLSKELISCPLLPWKEAGNQLTDRGWAFRVDGVRSPIAAKPLEPLVWMGYHQQFYRQDQKSWLFFPNMSASDRPSEYQANTLRHYEAEGHAVGEKLVDPVPFVVGDMVSPKLVVIVEGQWDAATLYGALGGFEDGYTLPVLVFGLRGVSSIEQLFAYWGRWLRWQAHDNKLENIWLIADADAPGMRLLNREGRVGEVPKLSFADRLKAIIGCRVVASHTREVKDFNDYYKANQPSIDEMWGLLDGMKLV